MASTFVFGTVWSNWPPFLFLGNVLEEATLKLMTLLLLVSPVLGL